MSKTRDTGNIGNVVRVDTNGNVSFVSGSTTLMSVSSSGAVTTTGVISGSNALSASFSLNSALLNGTGSVGFATTGALLEVSSSQQQVSASYISLSGSYNTFSGSASTRITANSSSIQQVSSSLLQVSASYTALSGSYNTYSSSVSTRTTQIEQVYATTGSNSFRANQSITGSLVVSSTITAQTLVVQTVTSSIVYSSGSNIFGSALTNTQTFTGSMLITGSNIIANVGTACFSGQLCVGSSLVLGTNNAYALYLKDSAGNPKPVMATAGNTNLNFYNVCSTGKININNAADNAVLMSIDNTGAACFASTITGTTIYGSTAVCSPVGKFTTCIDAGTGTFSGAVGVGQDLQINSNAGYGLKSANGTRLFEVYNTGVSFVTTLSGTSAAFSSTITGTTIYGSTAVCSAFGYFSGCVGIGTISPSTNLEVYRCTTDRNTLTRTLILNNNSNSNPYSGFGTGILFKGTDYSNAVQCYGAIDAIMEFSNRSAPQPDTGFCAGMIFSTGTNGALTERMRITSGGNIGIGCTTPGYKLSVVGAGDVALNVMSVGNSQGAAPYAIFNTGGNSPDYQASTNTCYVLTLGTAGGTSYCRYSLHTYGSVHLAIAEGCLGVGCTSPSYLLDVNGAGRMSGNLRIGGNTATSVGNSTDPAITATGCTKVGIYWAGNQVGFGAGSSTFFAILPNCATIGDVDFTWGYSGRGLHLSKAGAGPKKSLYADGNTYLYFGGPDTSSWARIYAMPGSAGMYMNNGDTSWTSNSDLRIKTCITKIENSLNKIMCFSGYEYQLKDDCTGKIRLGVIAQEIENILPQVVSCGYSPEHNDNILGVSYTDLIPVLVNAIQELKQQNDTFKTCLGIA